MKPQSLLFLGVGTKLTKDFLIKYVNESVNINKVITIVSDQSQKIIFNREIEFIELDFYEINQGNYPKELNEKTPLDLEIFNLMNGKILSSLKMMDRADTYSLFDSESRFELFFTHLEFWYSLIKEKKIDLIISSDMPHETQDYIAYSLCEVLEIKRCFIAQSQIHQFYQILIDIEINDNRLEKYKESDLPNDTVTNPVMAEYFKSQQNENYVPFYMTGGTAVPVTHRKKTLRNYLNIFFNKIRFFIKNKLYVFENIIGFLYKRSNYGSKADVNIFKYYDQNALIPDYSKKYIYVPLHFQPERTTSPQGGIFVFQMLMIKMISKAIPDDWIIYVKEHPWQMSKGRKITFYKEILELKNIFFVKRDTKSFNLINNAKVVSVISGTSGWESIFYKTPILVFGNIYFKYIDGAFEIKTNKNIKDALELIVSNQVSITDESIIQFLNCCNKYFFQGAFDEHYFPECGLNWKNNIDNLYENINSIIYKHD